MTHLSGPFEANEADVAEQQQSVTGEEVTVSEPTVSPDEANEADVLEQGLEVSTEDDDYPRDE
jgi:hypothetical protein